MLYLVLISKINDKREGVLWKDVLTNVVSNCSSRNTNELELRGGNKNMKKMGILFLQGNHTLNFLPLKIASTLLGLFEEGKKKAESQMLEPSWLSIFNSTANAYLYHKCVFLIAIGSVKLFRILRLIDGNGEPVLTAGNLSLWFFFFFFLPCYSLLGNVWSWRDSSILF